MGGVPVLTKLGLAATQYTEQKYALSHHFSLQRGAGELLLYVQQEPSEPGGGDPTS
jgi:hypothetical protein